MNWMEIILLIFGAGALAASFIIPAKTKSEDEGQQADEELIRAMMEKEMEAARERVTEVVDETLEYAVEKTERASERISNEKIMAISDYAETVLSDINKSHQEVMFLYDMLNDKHNNIKETVKHVDKTAKEAEEAANAAAIALAAKAKEDAEAKQKEQNHAEEARKEELERAALDKETREKEYARRQMARLILPLQPQLQLQPQPQLQPIPLKQDLRASGPEQKQPELRPLMVKSVEIVPADIVNSNDMQLVAEKENHGDVSANDLKILGSHSEDMKVVDAKPADIRQVEVYSFAEQAPHIERPVKREEQAAPLENTMNVMKQQEQAQQAADDAAENNNDRILRLHKLGVSNVDIAKELGLGVGEVKLVINLFKGAV